MEINKVTISKKSTIELRDYNRGDSQSEFKGIKFGDLIELKFKASYYYFKISEITYYQETKVVFIIAEQTGSSHSVLSDKIIGEDIFEFSNSEFSIVTDEELIKNIYKLSCYC